MAFLLHFLCAAAGLGQSVDIARVNTIIIFPRYANGKFFLLVQNYIVWNDEAFRNTNDKLDAPEN